MSIRNKLIVAAIAIGGAAFPSSAAAYQVIANFGGITIKGEGPVVLGCQGGKIVDVGGGVFPEQVWCAQIDNILVEGSPKKDLIDLSAVRKAEFTKLATVIITGGEGDDTLIGDQGRTGFNRDAMNKTMNDPGNDTIVGGKGNDLVFSGTGDDDIIWNEGDGNDDVWGGEGDDTQVITGAPVGDAFTLAPLGNALLFERVDRTPSQFKVKSEIKLEGLETVDMRSGGGEDVIDASAVTTARVLADGGADNDRILGSQRADFIDGGTGNDDIAANRGDDSIKGSDGDDIFRWANGDGSDAVSAGAGSDTLVGTGTPDAADVFTITGGAPVVRFARTNLVPFIMTLADAEVLDVDGLAGDDRITATPATGLAELTKLVLRGGDGNDALQGAEGADSLIGGSGDDRLDGGGGVDNLLGEAGADVITAVDGIADVVNCGADTDMLGFDAIDAFTECELGLDGEPIGADGAGTPPTPSYAAPQVRIGRAARVIEGKRLRLAVACTTKAPSCVVRVTVRGRPRGAKRFRAIGTFNVAVATNGKAKTISRTLSRSIRSLIAKRKLRTIRISARATAGDVVTRVTVDRRLQRLVSY